MSCRLRIILAEKNWTLRDLAKKTGLKYQYLSDIKNDRIKNPGVYQANIISKTLSIPTTEIWKNN
jgi:transcriptional regulator with XRE-family HTH domain